MLYLLHGPDDFSRGEALAEIKQEIDDPTLLATNTTVLDGRQLTPEHVRNVCATAPFLSEKRLVIIEGLLERFEPKVRSSRQQKTPSTVNKKDEYKLWASHLKDTPESTILVLAEGRVSNKNPLLKELSSKATVKSFPLLNKTRLRQWIEKRVRDEGSKISPQATDLLSKLVGSNLWIMNHEINKLALLASGRIIEQEDVKELVGYAQQASVFTMVDAILELRAGLAEQALQLLLDRGAAPAYLMVMLSRQIRMIARIKEFKHQGKSEVEIQNRLGLTSEFAFRKTLEQASSFPLERIKEVYHRLLETDLAIKTGKYKGELALNILIAELCQSAISR